MEILNKPIDIPIAPADLAKCFWQMDNHKQAEFFTELAAVIQQDHKTNPSSYSFGEKQWLALSESIKEKGGDTLSMYQSFSAFTYDFWNQTEES